MGKWYKRGVALLGCLASLGCAEQADMLKPAEIMASLQAGRPLLACHEPCLAKWRSVQPQAAQLDAGARWQDLAILLAGAGYQDDLSLYYLGRAAEGSGYRTAAVAYYRQSTLISGGANSCQSLSRLCGGVVLPKAAASRAAAVERELNRSRPRRGEPASPQPGTPAVAGEASSPAGPPPSEYIEPPPARR